MNNNLWQNKIGMTEPRLNNDCEGYRFDLTYQPNLSYMPVVVPSKNIPMETIIFYKKIFRDILIKDAEQILRDFK